MIDPFIQWIVVPDDQSDLPPVDEDICGLKDFSSLRFPNDLRTGQGYDEPSSGLLLGPDLYHNVCQDVDAFSVITPGAGQNILFPTSDSSPSSLSSYTSLLPPALSPDSSPTSVASSTPWPRTPETDLLFTSVANFTPEDALWDIVETDKESCSAIHFLDQAGNRLEDIPSQAQDVMPEDIACTPHITYDTALPLALVTTPCEGPVGLATPAPISNTPTFVISSPFSASASPVEVAPHWPAHCTSLPPSLSHIPQSLLVFSPGASHPQEAPPEYATSPTLSPLSTLSFFSRSPSTTPNPSPLLSCSSLSPAFSPVPLSNNDERVGAIDSVSSTFTRVTSAKLRGKRRAGSLDEDAPSWKMPRRSKAKDVDEEEWNPESERVKRPRATASSQSIKQTAASILHCQPDESPNCETSQGSEGLPDATHTTCEICGQGFTRTSDYMRHIENSASHPETRKVWPCPYCDSALGRKDALGRHIRTLHPGKPVFIPEGVPGNQLPEGRNELSVQRIGQRKMPLRRQLRKDTRRCR